MRGPTLTDLIEFWDKVDYNWNKWASGCNGREVTVKCIRSRQLSRSIVSSSHPRGLIIHDPRDPGSSTVHRGISERHAGLHMSKLISNKHHISVLYYCIDLYLRLSIDETSSPAPFYSVDRSIQSTQEIPRSHYQALNFSTHQNCLSSTYSRKEALLVQYNKQ